MSKAYTQFRCRIKQADDVDYTDPDVFEASQEAGESNLRSRDELLVPTSPSVETIAIGTETVKGMFVKCTSTLCDCTVKWNTTNKVRLTKGSTADNGDWMFIPDVDSSSNVTLEGEGGNSKVIVRIFYVETPM